MITGETQFEEITTYDTRKGGGGYQVAGGLCLLGKAVNKIVSILNCFTTFGITFAVLL